MICQFPRCSVGLQNFIICIEMFLGAVAHHQYFNFTVSPPSAYFLRRCCC